MRNGMRVSDYDFKGEVLGMAEHQIVRKKGFSINQKAVGRIAPRNILIQMNDIGASA